jgi:hypothetical protein
VARKANFGFLATARVSLSTLWSVLLFAVVFHSGSAWAQSASDEYHVKAAFLFHFAQLVEWPADTSSDSGNSLLLCTLGADPFHGELENTIQGKQIGSRTIRIRQVNPSQATRGCNVLFISKGEGKRLPMLLASLQNLPVLTVGESDDFLGSGGMIRFLLEGNKVRFEINRKATESAKLKISSQLLFLAKNVVGGR